MLFIPCLDVSSYLNSTASNLWSNGASCSLSCTLRVAFPQQDVWELYQGSPNDTVEVEIYQPWLEAATEQDLTRQHQRAEALRQQLVAEGDGSRHHHHHHHYHHHGHNHHEHSQAEGTAAATDAMAAAPSSAAGGTAASAAPAAPADDNDHHHHHHHQQQQGQGQPSGVIDHGNHVHEAREQVEAAAVEKEGDTGGRERLGLGLLGVLLAKVVLNADELREEMETLDAKGVKGDGARLVARAWVDPAFKVSTEEIHLDNGDSK